MKKRILILLLAAFVLWALWANTAVEVNEWTVESEKLPEAFDGLRIAQISDLHNAEFGAGNRRLLKLLREAEPDLIVITADLIDSRNTDVGIALGFAAEAQKLAPCFYVPGNHESRVWEWTALRRGLLDAGVTVLTDESAIFERNGEMISIAGMSDPDFGKNFAEDLERLTKGEGYTILLSHRPERFEQYVRSGADLVFSGHAHGGQVRLPLVGGLIAPHQGFFPEYDSGLYERGGTAMLVSRGLGNSIAPLRFGNRPEILVAVLKRL